MPTFHDLLSGISPETGYPDDFPALATAAYDDDFSSVNAKVAELTAERDTLAAELQAQKVINYDLMASGVNSVDADAEPPTDNDGDESPEYIDIDDLFKPKSED